MTTIYSNIIASLKQGEKLLAVLIDPDKTDLIQIPSFMKKVEASVITHIFVGGSDVETNATQLLVTEIKRWTDRPVILFPGDINQLTEAADGLLFLSLISGRNPDFLIGKHVEAAKKLMHSNLDIIPTGYLLIENGKETAVQRVSGTKPIPRHDLNTIVQTVKAGALLGLKLIYLEAGSGATHPVNKEIIVAARSVIDIPLIVGGGIKTMTQLQDAFDAGADLVVIGTAIEENASFLDQLSLTSFKWNN
ncbi:MAG: geranylgeranylglyceryl/heptaprenylglyceryl phosphate synthase [Bacteroidia bacterium]|nr:geranylgeranylglyceryl/heptaprenylglyceryl phosphate synthase [Bacteroidia bacterium]